MLGFGRTFKKAILLSAGATLALSTSACTTTKTVKVSEAAPITYKVGKGATQYASTRMPSRVASTSPYVSSRPAAQPVYVPQVSAPQIAVPAPMPRAATPVFEQSRVDSDLYKHQKVGKTYTIMGKSYTPKHEPGYNCLLYTSDAADE